MVINSTNHVDVRAGIGKLGEKAHCVSLIRPTLAIFQMKTQGRIVFISTCRESQKLFRLEAMHQEYFFPIIQKEK